MRFRLGINYWPVSCAMYWWQRFDRAEVEQDFARISDAGFDSVRIFLLWEDFQPGPRTVSDQALDNLASVASLAERNNLLLVATLFTGHMSGVNWIPEWALESGNTPSRFRTVSRGRVVNSIPRNWYTDEGVLEAQLLLASRVAARLREMPAIWAYDLGNENSNCVVPPSRESATRWLEAMASEIRSVDRQRPITIGLHMEDLEEDRNLGPAEAARVSDFLCMHGYPVYAPWAQGPTDAMLLPFLGTITRWLSGAEQLDVVFQEFGATTAPKLPGPIETHAGSVPMLGEDEAARFTGRALDSLRQFGFLGAMVWCFADYSSALWSCPPFDQSLHERSFGLWRTDHSAKPALSEIYRFSGADCVPWHDEFGWINISPSEFYCKPRVNLDNLYRRFRERYT